MSLSSSSSRSGWKGWIAPKGTRPFPSAAPRKKSFIGPTCLGRGARGSIIDFSTPALSIESRRAETVPSPGTLTPILLLTEAIAFGAISSEYMWE